MATKLIGFQEVTKNPEGGTKESLVLLNPEGIVCVNTTELKNDGPHIVGVTKKVEVSFIQLTTGRGVYVAESVERIGEIVNDNGRPGPVVNNEG